MPGILNEANLIQCGLVKPKDNKIKISLTNPEGELMFVRLTKEQAFNFTKELIHLLFFIKGEE